VGRPAVRAYAARASQSVEEYLERRDVATVSPAYLLTGAGLEEPHGD
jgi:hypothetical protein